METLIPPQQLETAPPEQELVPEEIQEQRGRYHFVIDHSESENVIQAHVKASDTTSCGQIVPSKSEYSVVVPTKNVTPAYIADIRQQLTAMGFTIEREYQEA